MSEQKKSAETPESGETGKETSKRAKIVSYAVLGIFVLLLPFLVFATLP